MRNGLLVVSTENSINIGDYIQGLSAKQYFDKIDEYIEREQLNKNRKSNIRIIMNGWYMHHPDNWPPSTFINPLFVAFHINSVARDSLLSERSISYLKTKEPIGCRDIETAELLKAKGVNAYFSGCLTLTLGLKYKSKEKENKSYFVDPYYKLSKRPYNLVVYLLYLFVNYKTINCISRKKFSNCSVKSLLKTACFFKSYKKIFSKDLLLNSEYISHEGLFLKGKYKSNDELFHYAEELIHKYSKASLVITSRIHCALPCLGLETPVIYVENKEQSETSKCRLKGLIELLNVIPYSHGKLIKDNFNKKISLLNIPKNKKTWEKIAFELKKTCEKFVNKQ